jgi:hypothetical protein
VTPGTKQACCCWRPLAQAHVFMPKLGLCLKVAQADASSVHLCAQQGLWSLAGVQGSWLILNASRCCTQCHPHLCLSREAAKWPLERTMCRHCRALTSASCRMHCSRCI